MCIYIYIYIERLLYSLTYVFCIGVDRSSKLLSPKIYRYNLCLQVKLIINETF